MWRSEDDVETVTFAEFRQRAETFAVEYLNRRVSHGDTVIIIMPQGVALMASFAGAMMVGAVPAILAYPSFKVEPAKYRHGLSGVSANLKARLVVVDYDFPDELLDYVSASDSAQVLKCAGSELPAVDFERVRAFDPDDLAFIQHSAGTTGLQKGVALTHGAVLRQLDHLAETLLLSESDRIYSWLPLYHDMGLITCFILPLVYHLPIVMQSPTDWVMQPGSMLELITANRCTLAWVPNFAFQLLSRRVRRDDRDKFDLTSLRALINCSEPVRAESVNELLETYAHVGLKPETLQSSYAMAENVFAVTQSRIGSVAGHVWVDGEMFRSAHVANTVLPDAPGALDFISSGFCLPENQLRIVSPDGLALSDGEVGEVVISSDSLFDGYYNRPDLTELVLKDGWFWTGDLGFCLDDELYVVGRKKDLIIVGGKNIYPQDVEEIVHAHPAIHDGRAIALGVYNPELGTEDILVVAEVEQEDALAVAADIERAVKAAIVAELGVTARGVYLKPSRWIVKSTAGKAARAATREKLFAEHPELAQHGFATGG